MSALLRRGSRVHRTIAALLIVLYLPACSSWTTLPAAPAQAVSAKHRNVVRLLLRDSTTVQLAHPLVEGDSLVGRVPDPASVPDSLRPRRAVAIADVTAVQVPSLTTTSTVLAGVGVAALLVAVIAATSDGISFGSTGQASCPVVYAWDGRGWVLQSGTFAGAIAEGVARTDVTAMPQAVATGGRLRLEVRNELEETDHLDALSVLAVDHAPGVTIAPDAGGALHAVGVLAAPAIARDLRGRDVLAQVAALDGRAWESALVPRDTARPEDLRDGIELAFAHPANAGTAHLVVDARNPSWVPFLLERALAAHAGALDAWYDSLRLSPRAAEAYRQAVVREAGLRVLLWRDGRWQAQGVVLDPGPELTRRQVVPLDLAGLATGPVRVRLESAPSFWLLDRVALAAGPEPAFTVRELGPAAAVTADGRDVLTLVAAADGRDWAFEQGERAALDVPVPAVPAGVERSYLVRAAGWYRLRVPLRGDADYAALERLLAEPGAFTRWAVGLGNTAFAGRRVATAASR